MAKNFKLKPDQIKDLAKGWGACIATDAITVHGLRVGYMYREEPHNPKDSGWRFLAGNESDAYLADSKNLDVYFTNTIANYDPEIIPLLSAPEGSAFERGKDGKLRAVSPRPGSLAAINVR
ncbi:MAG: DUF2185 domain-containing protein [Hyphomonadaceae bacterium]|nr:DUF2185 domain-containing protein [Hyphomonadaceae bacterium]